MNKRNIQDFYPLSPMQQGMFFHSLLAPESGVYVELFQCTLQGDLDVDAFHQAWQRVVQRHPILRTGFTGEGLKEPIQVVHRQVDVPLRLLDLRRLSPEEQEQRLEALVAEERQRGFALAKPPLMRLTLARTGDDTHRFIWTHHHILLDGWSSPILMQEVFAWYEALRRGQTPTLPPAHPYRDYIVWLRRQDMAQAERFWKENLAGFQAPTPLTVDQPPDEAEEERYEEVDRVLSQELTQQLRELARSQRVTLSTLIHGAWALLLSRYSGEEDVVFGATVSGRPADLPGAEFMIGLFINTLPVRARIQPELPVGEWLRHFQEHLVELRQYEYSPLVRIQGWSDVPRQLPLFESILVFENYPTASALEEEGQEGSLTIRDVGSIEQTNYPLNLIAGADEELMLKILYDCRRFQPETIQRMLGHLEQLLQSMAQDPQRRVRELSLLTPEEEWQILVEWNQTRADYPLDTPVHRLIEEQVERTPEAMAVWHEGRSLSYRELNDQANRLAHFLRRQGVGPDTPVGIAVERSPEMLVAVLGVLKAGGAYLPLDPAYPKARLQFMLEDAQAPVLLTQESLVNNLPISKLPSPISVFKLDADWPTIAQESPENPDFPVRPEHLAYIIYTSGSTGRPKGVLLEHRGLTNLVCNYALGLHLPAGKRVFQFFSLNFDGSVGEIFPALVQGVTLYLPTQETLLSTTELQHYLQEHAITHLTLTPSLLAILPEGDYPNLETIVVGGEACPNGVARRWLKEGRLFINAYGPTEITMVATWHMVREAPPTAGIVPIGRPVDNTHAFVLDRYGHPVPVGVPGELYVGGVGVARGYLNRPELTAERFVSAESLGARKGQLTHALAKALGKVNGKRTRLGNGWKEEELEERGRKPEDGASEDASYASRLTHFSPRLYRTGDIVRYRPNGDLEFLGRVDDQVKVRGFRIELGEIEAALGEHPQVHEAAVTVWEDDSGDKRLVAYVVEQTEDGRRQTEVGSGESADGEREQLTHHASRISELRSFLAQRLPHYMVPATFVPVEALPRLPNGKVDRKALPRPGSRSQTDQEPVPPRDIIEAELVRIWEEILGVQPIGVEDNFFDLGGHSLLAVRVIGQIQKQFGEALGLVDLLQGGTVAHLAQLLRRHLAGEVAATTLVPLQERGTKPPLYFVHPSGGSVHWYAELARLLDPERPFFGIQAKGLDGREELHTSIPEMAEHYVEAILEAQPDGPYLLGSWSLGVAIVYEMAQQLVKRGKSVPFLAILDQGPTIPYPEPEDLAAYLINVFGKHVPVTVEELRALPEEEQVPLVYQRARAVNWLLPDVSLEQFHHFVKMLKVQADAWRRYEPQPYPGRITLFRAQEQPPESPPERDMGWAALAQGGVDVRDVPGDHLSMLQEPHVRVLAEEMQRCLEQLTTLANSVS